MTLRHTNSVFHEGNNQFKGLGIVKWCALCGVHRPIQDGTIQHVLGGRHFCCAKHPDPKDVKCEPAPRATKTVTKAVPVPPAPPQVIPPKSLKKTVTKKKTKVATAAAALEVVKAGMTALAVPLVVAPVKSVENATPTISQNPIRTTWRHINGPL